MYVMSLADEVDLLHQPRSAMKASKSPAGLSK
jgi:hypothetical protein